MERDPEHEIEPGVGVGVGDGSLGGPAIGGSLTSPDAGIIRDPVAADVAAPLLATPDEPEQPGGVSDDLKGDTERPTG